MIARFSKTPNRDQPSGVGFADVEATLKDMAKTGYVGITNDPATGIVLYDFKEL
jgi:hypothetical protein